MTAHTLKRGEAFGLLRPHIGQDGIDVERARAICGFTNGTDAGSRLNKMAAAGQLHRCKVGGRVRWFLTAADRDAWMAANSKPAPEPLPIVGDGGPWGAGPMPAGFFSEPVRAWFGAYFRSDLLDPDGPHNILQHNLAMQLAKQARQAREDGKGWAREGAAVQALERRA